MRQYQPIWERIKKHKEATIVSPNSLHRRIIQAVRKEKWRDIGFKLLTSEANSRLKLVEEVDRKKGTIKFFLKETSGIDIGDL